ncbi:MAG: HTH-type transcriptional regulator / antitoxin HigA [Candidatus Sumerlaeota bacterium]|nr:HTH-type transcriptional regulator / antitoxin HigA [Candidatus Sumerlaeota bacterium]
MMTENAVMSDLAIPPGEYLEEVLRELGMTKEEMARRMGRPASKLSQIFNGTKRITEETALQLEKVVGVPAHFWTGLESEYRLTLARNEERERDTELAEEAPLAKKFCYKELAALGEVPDTRNRVKRVRALRAYLGVTKLSLATEMPRYRAAARFRCGRTGKRSPEAIAAWLRHGERQAQRLETAPFREERLRSVLPALRALTNRGPGGFEEELQSMLASCGVALVICPHFTKTYAHGATFRLNPSKPVLMITVRGAWADIFWFSLFHEIGHILLHGSAVILEEDGADDDREREANEFAGNLLIPANEYGCFTARNRFTEGEVVRFAGEIGIHPGIVVGRLQHDKRISHNCLLHLRAKLALRVAE